MSQEPEKIESTPELEQIAALALNGLLSNSSVLYARAQLNDANLEAFADAAFKAAVFLQQRLHQARTNG